MINNIPDLLHLHHNNPLGIPPLALILAILVLTAVMSYFNFQIRHRGKLQLYPVLYALFPISLVVVYYYCFIDLAQLPSVSYAFADTAGPALGWFCSPAEVGWPLAVVGGLALVFVIYNLLSATMQINAEMTRTAEMDTDKKWKEWKMYNGLGLFCATVACIFYYVKPSLSGIILQVSMVLLLVALVVKIVSDARSCHNVWKALAIGVTYCLGFMAVLMLCIESLFAFPVLILFLMYIFSMAKAKKKTKKEKK